MEPQEATLIVLSVIAGIAVSTAICLIIFSKKKEAHSPPLSLDTQIDPFQEQMQESRQLVNEKNKPTINRMNYTLVIIGCFIGYILIHIIFNPANYAGPMSFEKARTTSSALALIYTAALLPLSIVFFNTIRRRLWDAGRSAWLTPVAVIPIIGLLFLLILCILPPNKQPPQTTLATPS